jgi:hypothetical protein
MNEANLFARFQASAIFFAPDFGLGGGRDKHRGERGGSNQGLRHW